MNSKMIVKEILTFICVGVLACSGLFYLVILATL
ncbi:uncharacterized protein METZ01_LOCUS406438 [marine metagenome]|uniref:Uncharacterized protein n=1 Tax=marine metagenome TaxID=408172 RepID=A0A382W4G1_9ZZZZ